MQDARQIDLKERQIIEHEGHPLGGLVIHSGILRVAGHFPAANSEVTLAIVLKNLALFEVNLVRILHRQQSTL